MGQQHNTRQIWDQSKDFPFISFLKHQNTVSWTLYIDLFRPSYSKSPVFDNYLYISLDYDDNSA